MALQAGRFVTVGDVLRRFRQQGCSVLVAEESTHMPDGDVLNVRYVLSPDRRRFIPLVDLDDSDRISDTEVAFWEESLGISILRE